MMPLRDCEVTASLSHCSDLKASEVHLVGVSLCAWLADVSTCVRTAQFVLALEAYYSYSVAE